MECRDLIRVVLFVGYVGIAVDVTDGKRVEEALRERERERERELTEAQRLAAVGSWHWESRTTVIWSRELYRLISISLV
jgi:hypothetical protein